MRKLLLLTPFLLLNIGYAKSETSACTQVTQSAVSPAGECQVFPTPCDVPADYKTVPSCDIVKDRDFGSSLEDRMKKRFSRIQKNKAKNSSIKRNTRRGFGQSAGVGYKRDRVTRKHSDREKTGTRKTSTRKNYSAVARNRAKRLNRNQRGGYQHVGDTTSAERKDRRQGKHRIRSSVTKNLSKKLSNKPSWSAEKNRRSRTIQARKSWNNSHMAEKRRDARSARKKRIHQGIKLQKTWKGERIEGSLTK